MTRLTGTLATLVSVVMLSVVSCTTTPSATNEQPEQPAIEATPVDVGRYLDTASPALGSTGVPVDTDVYLSFTAPVAERSLSRVSIDPRVPFEAHLQWYVGPATQLTLNLAPLSPETTYTITLEPEFWLNGRPIGEVWSYRFTTESAP